MQLLALALLALTAAVTAAPEPGVEFSAVASAETVMAAEADAGILPSAELEVDGPLVVGGLPLARGLVRLRLLGLPGETVDLTSVETFRSAEVDLAVYRRIGRLSLGNQEVWSSVQVAWGFATRLPEDPVPLQRYVRQYGVGIRIEERASGAWISVLYGRHQAAGPRGFGQVIAAGQVPLGFTRGLLFIGGEAVLSVGTPRAAPLQRDFARLRVGISLPDLVGLIR